MKLWRGFGTVGTVHTPVRARAEIIMSAFTSGRSYVKQNSPAAREWGGERPFDSDWQRRGKGREKTATISHVRGAPRAGSAPAKCGGRSQSPSP